MTALESGVGLCFVWFGVDLQSERNRTDCNIDVSKISCTWPIFRQNGDDDGIKGTLEKCVHKFSFVSSTLSNEVGRLPLSKQFVKGCECMHTVVEKGSILCTTFSDL